MNIDIYDGELLSGSDDKVLKKMKGLLQWQPQYKPLLNTKVVLNIYDIYEKMILENSYPILYADKWSTKTAHFTRDSWKTINELTRRTALPKVFIMTYSEAVWILAKTGKIPASVVNPKLKKEGVKKFFEGLGNFGKIAVPLVAVSAGLIALSYLQSQKTRFSYGK